jgi:uncharacterized protein YycO
MQILLCRSRTLGSVLIRALTWSAWSHAVLVMGEQCVEATWPRVRLSSVAAVRAAHDEWTLLELPCTDPALAWHAALDQIGRPYDWAALLGFLVHRDWAAPDRWFCSELVAFAFAAGGSPLFRPDLTYRVTPQMLWELPPTNPAAAPAALS